MISGPLLTSTTALHWDGPLTECTKTPGETSKSLAYEVICKFPFSSRSVSSSFDLGITDGLNLFRLLS